MKVKILYGKNLLILGVLFATLMNVALFFNLSAPESAEPRKAVNHVATGSKEKTLLRKSKHNEKKIKKHKVHSNDKSLSPSVPQEIKNVFSTMIDLTSSSYQRLSKKIRESSKRRALSKGEWGVSGTIKISDDDIVIKSDDTVVTPSSVWTSAPPYRLPRSFYPRARNAIFISQANRESYAKVLNSRSIDPEATLIKLTDGQDGERLVFFLHIHKSGGGQVCQLAKFHNWTESKHPKCLLKGVSLAKKDKNPLSSKIIFSEIVLTHQLNIRKYLYAMTIRSPLNRIKSHIRTYGDSEYHIRQWTQRGAKFHPDAYDFSADLITGTVPYDNAMVRALTKPSTYLKPPQTLDRTDYEYAAATLAQFEIIVVLERYERDAKIQFPRLLGWHVYLMSGKNDEKFKGAELSEEFMNYLEVLNQFDYELYNLALVLSDDINQRALRLNPPFFNEKDIELEFEAIDSFVKENTKTQEELDQDLKSSLDRQQRLSGKMDDQFFDEFDPHHMIHFKETADD